MRNAVMRNIHTSSTKENEKEGDQGISTPSNVKGRVL